MSNEPRDYNQPLPEPEDPRDLPMPPRLLRRRTDDDGFRNGMASAGVYVAGAALVLEVLIGTPILLFLSLVALGMGLVGWARVHRKQANNGRKVVICIVVAIAAVAVGGFWATRTNTCTFVDVNRQETCIKEQAGLL